MDLSKRTARLFYPRNDVYEKNIYIFVAFILLASIASPCGATSQFETEIYYLEDGSYYIVALDAVPMSRSNNIRGQKTAEYYSADNELQWRFILTASFTYNPDINASCNDAACEVEIYNSAWSCSSQSARAISARAFADAEMVQKLLFVTIKTVPVSLNITCDANGNLS